MKTLNINLSVALVVQPQDNRQSEEAEGWICSQVTYVLETHRSSPQAVKPELGPLLPAGEPTLRSAVCPYWKHHTTRSQTALYEPFSSWLHSIQLFQLTCTEQKCTEIN